MATEVITLAGRGDTLRCTHAWSPLFTEGALYQVVEKDGRVGVADDNGVFLHTVMSSFELVTPDSPSIGGTTCPSPNNTPSQGYPDDNPKTVIGLTKPPMHVIPTAALIHLGQAMKDGAAKYGLMNWRQHNVSSSVYYDAAMRHLMSWWDGEENAQDSGVHHLAHAMACLAIILDAQENGGLNDNRPIPGNASELIARLTKKAAA